MYDVLLHKEVLFGGLDVTAVRLGAKIPPKKTPFGASIGIFKPNTLNINTCISSKLLH